MMVYWFGFRHSLCSRRNGGYADSTHKERWAAGMPAVVGTHMKPPIFPHFYPFAAHHSARRISVERKLLHGRVNFYIITKKYLCIQKKKYLCIHTSIHIQIQFALWSHEHSPALFYSPCWPVSCFFLLASENQFMLQKRRYPKYTTDTHLLPIVPCC